MNTYKALLKVSPLLASVFYSSLIHAETPPANPFFHLSSNEIGLSLYKKLYNKNSNLCFSPYSLQAAMSMTMNGAAGVTYEEMGKALSHGGADLNFINASFKEYQENLTKRLKKTENGKGTPIQFSTANQLFGQEGYDFKRTFLSICESYYNAPLIEMDFKKFPDQSRKEVNAWVSKKTNEKIKDLLPVKSVTADTRLILTNAVHFHASWKEPFSKKLTKDKEFTTADGSVVKVPTMHKTSYYGYEKRDGYETIGLPYGVRNEFQLLILLPEEGKSLKELVDSISMEDLFKMQTLARKNLMLAIPKFKVEGETIAIKEELKALGMISAFGRSADFSEMEPQKELRISNVYHKAFIELSEKGTEAAAATAVVKTRKSTSVKPDTAIQVKVNRPFFYAIQDIKTGNCVFMGNVQSIAE